MPLTVPNTCVITQISPAQPVYPFHRVEELLRSREVPHELWGETIGTTQRTLYRWAQSGLNWEQADRVAIALGTHPAELWPEWFLDVDQVLELLEHENRQLDFLDVDD